MVVGGIVLGVVALLPVWRPVEPGTGRASRRADLCPTRASRHRSQELTRPGDRIFNPQPWGSWFEFALPDTLVAIDSRIELFPAAVWDDYAKVVAGVDGWQAILNGWDVTFVVVEVENATFVSRLQTAGWQVVHVDPDATVMARP